MPTLEELIVNDLIDMLGHEPTNDELHSLSEYLSARHIEHMVTMETYVRDWKDIFTRECAWCGKRYHVNEMIGHDVRGNWYCNEQCRKDYETEHGAA